MGKTSEEKEKLESHQSGAFDDFDSTCSTPYVSAPSSPGRPSLPTTSAYFFSAPASPMHFFSIPSGASIPIESDRFPTTTFSSLTTDFEFSSRVPSSGPDSGSTTPTATMISADELFLNGQIRPLQKPLLKLDALPDVTSYTPPARETGIRGGLEFRSKNRSVHRRTRSLSPLRNPDPGWPEETVDEKKAADPPPTVSATARRSSSRWTSLKDFLYRSKSEGRGYVKEKILWSALSFSSSPSSNKEKEKRDSVPAAAGVVDKKKQRGGSSTSSGSGKRRIPVPAEQHYAAKKAQAEEMRKKTFLPYRQGLLGCLGFSSRGYSVVNDFAKTLHHHQPVSSSG